MLTVVVEHDFTVGDVAVAARSWFAGRIDQYRRGKSWFVHTPVPLPNGTAVVGIDDPDFVPAFTAWTEENQVPVVKGMEDGAHNWAQASKNTGVPTDAIRLPVASGGTQPL